MVLKMKTNKKEQMDVVRSIQLSQMSAQHK